MNVNTDYIRRRFKFNSPEKLKELFTQYPLDKNFIDWVYNLGFKIFYNQEMHKGGGCVNWDDKLIVVSTKSEDSRLIKLITVHELVHIASGNEIEMELYNSPPEKHLDLYDGYEKAIDDIAEEHLNNKVFMEYMESRLPRTNKEECTMRLKEKHPEMGEAEFMQILGSF